MSMHQVPRHRAAPAAAPSSRSRLGTAGEHRALIAISGAVFLGAFALALGTLPWHAHSPERSPDYAAAAEDGARFPDSAAPSLPSVSSLSPTATIAVPSSVTRGTRERPIKVGGAPALTGRPMPSSSQTGTAAPRAATTHPAQPQRPGASGSAAATTAPAPAAALPDPVQVAQAVFDAVNASRRDAGLRPLAWNWRLQTSANQHNQAMAQADVLSHQLPGEDDLGRRESAAGVVWWWAGENIGETSSMTTQGALDLETAMLNEQPPNDGHRANILARNADALGVDVVLDPAHHTLWLTEDFAQTSLL
jgi:uncharacterized protein YkwD